jgi:hypothetical protein
VDFINAAKVNGIKGFTVLVDRVLSGEWDSLFEGTVATILCTVVSHYPWFLTINLLDVIWPKSTGDNQLLRNAIVGFIASAIADVVSNPIRVVKTMKQSLAVEKILPAMSYSEIAVEIIQQNGWSGLFFRGLDSRILSNGLQSMLFTVVWKFLVDRFLEKLDVADADKKNDAENIFMV